jgi:integrase/recombinase XerD
MNILPVPFEKIDLSTIPAELSGACGANRVNVADCGIDARNDVAAIHSFLQVKSKGGKSLQTYRAYRKEAERLLLWSWIERDTSLSSLKVDDILAYRKFLVSPRPVGVWVGNAVSRDNPGWRPFQGGLIATSIEFSNKILHALFAYLVNAHYLKLNVVELAGKLGTEKMGKDRKLMDVERFFPQKVWEEICAALETLPRDTDENAQRSDRMRFIVYAYYYTGARLSELVNAKMSAFKKSTSDDGAIRWWLRITGKGRRERDVAVHDLMPELQRYRVSRGLTPFPRISEKNVPLIARLNDGMASVTGNMIDKELRKFFNYLAADLDERDPVAAGILSHASAHWMRHSMATHALANGAELLSVSRQLGHSDLTVTSTYLHSEDTVRYDDMKLLKKI